MDFILVPDSIYAFFSDGVYFMHQQKQRWTNERRQSEPVE